MKKLFILFAILFATQSMYAQEYNTYLITRSEWYLYDELKEEWILQTQHKDAKIEMVTYKNVIEIKAEKPSFYILDEKTEEPIKGKEFSGLGYSGIEWNKKTKCTLHIVFLDENQKFFLFSVIYKLNGEKINLRFYAKYE